MQDLTVAIPIVPLNYLSDIAEGRGSVVGSIAPGTPTLTRESPRVERNSDYGASAARAACAQGSATKNTVTHTAIAATNAESNARSFLSSSRDVPHQPSYARMLAMVPSSSRLNSAGNRRPL